MKFPPTTRSLWRCAATAVVAALLGSSVLAQYHSPKEQSAPPPAPVVRQPPPPNASPQPAPATSTLAPIQRHQNPGLKVQNGEHLAEWLNRHSNLTPTQQQQALEKEPGFHDLPQATQQRMRDRIVKLNNMSPEQRDKLLANTEAIERLTPDQRGQVRNAMQQVAALPPASRRAVQRTFRDVRDMSPAQREAYLNSPDIRSQFSDQELGALTNLMAVEPYLPPRNPGEPNF